ncbi:hypothetical protein FRC02_000472 [Tulasnella sp. 418]|nr:hypothetical protein FRC02_000472 [Tulasnella sp. 418]
MPKPSVLKRLHNLVNKIEILTKRHSRKSLLPKDLSKDLDDARASIERLDQLFPGQPWVTRGLKQQLQDIKTQLKSIENDLNKIVESGGVLPKLENLKSSADLGVLIAALNALDLEVTMKKSKHELNVALKNPILAPHIEEYGAPNTDIIEFNLVCEDNMTTEKKKLSAHKKVVVRGVPGAWSEVWQCELNTEDAEVVGFHTVSTPMTSSNKSRTDMANLWKVAYKSLVIDRDVEDLEQTEQLSLMAQRHAREKEVWIGLPKHPNIAPLLGVVDESYGFISPWYSNGSLEKFPKGKSFHIKVQLLQGAANGLAYLHSLDKVHGDFRPPNILVDDDIQAKVIDFGGTVDEKTGIVTKSRVPNLKTWMAPERMGRDDNGHDKNLIPTKKSDIYCFGLLCIKVMTEAEPNTSDDYRRVSMLESNSRSESGIKDQFSLSPTCEEDWKRKDALSLLPLVQDCWAFDPAARPPMAKVVERLRDFVHALDSYSTSSL